MESKSWCFYPVFAFMAVSAAVSVQMRIVKDTASYGYSDFSVGDNGKHTHSPNGLPSNFSGPMLLKKLMDNCFNFTQDLYQYSFCPFQNFSQSEISSKWNAYHGILGYWSHWNIRNGVFQSMMYTHGDHCGNLERTVEVNLQCGSNEALLNVTEPHKCSYSAIFASKYLCHNDSMVVYPRLSVDLQKQWDELLTEYHFGYVTKKGYDLQLEKIFEKAGFLQTKLEEERKEVTAAPKLSKNLFTDLSSCNKEYKNIAKEFSRLNQEIDDLKLLMDLAKLKNRTKPYL